MTSTNPARRVLAAVAALTVVVTTVAAVLAGATASSATAAASSATSSARTGATAAPARTTLTLKIAHCERCKVSPAQGLWDENAHQGIRSWSGPTKTVHDGKVTFKIATKHLHGMSLTMTAPWERRLGYVTNVVMRYKDFDEGDRVTFQDARTQRRGSACWAGTDADEVTMRIVARKVRVEGTAPHRVPGTIAFVRQTQDWMHPMRRAWKGVMGSQDLNICGPKS